MKDIARVMNLGVSIITSLFMGLLLGYGLDRLLKTEPVFLVIGILLGFTGALGVLYDVVVKKK